VVPSRGFRERLEVGFRLDGLVVLGGLGIDWVGTAS
jgi:hypothetical protein